MKEPAKKRKWGSIIFLIFIMVGLSVGSVFYGLSPASEKVKYNGLSFTTNGQFWTSKIGGKEAAFTFLPAETEDIKTDDFAKILSGKYEIDLTSEANSTNREAIALAENQMGLTLQNYNIFLRGGFTSNNSFGFPVITCRNATQYTPVVYFRNANATSIRVQDYCVIAEAPSNSEFVRAKDRIVYGILGVMP